MPTKIVYNPVTLRKISLRNIHRVNQNWTKDADPKDIFIKIATLEIPVVLKRDLARTILIFNYLTTLLDIQPRLKKKYFKILVTHKIRQTKFTVPSFIGQDIGLKTEIPAEVSVLRL